MNNTEETKRILTDEERKQVIAEIMEMLDKLGLIQKSGDPE